MSDGGDLVPRDDQLDLRHPHFEAVGVRWHRTGLEITSDLDYPDLESIAYVLSRTSDASRFGLCDALAHAERRWGEDKYSQLAEVTGRSVGGLMNLASLARRVPPEIRRPELTLGHHEEVAGLKIAGTDEPDREAQARWLQQAVDLRLTRDDLRNQIQASRENLTRRVRSETSPPPIVESPTTESPSPPPPSDIDYDRIIEAARAVVDSAVGRRRWLRFSEPVAAGEREGRWLRSVDADHLTELGRALPKEPS